MVDITDIPDFPGLPGQRPIPAAPTDVEPVAVVLVTAPLDSDGVSTPLNSGVVDAFIAAEITAGRALEVEVERWNPWSPLQIELGYGDARKYNYARITLEDSSVWYAFLSAEYLTLTATRYMVEPDDCATYDYSIGYSTILQGHVAVAASAGGDTNYCLEPETMGPGELIGYSAYQHDPLGAPRVLVISTTDLNANPFVPVDTDLATSATDLINSVETSGSIEAPTPPLSPSAFYPYSYGSSTYDDLLYYPYAERPGLSAGNPMSRPYAAGATPSTVDGVAVDGGAFVYPSIGAAITHLSKIAHTPWISDGIQRVVLLPGGSAGGGSPVDLSPRDAIPDTSGGPTYHAALSTIIDYDTTLTTSWTANLPPIYNTWTKLRTAPYAQIQIADRQGATSDYDPQSITDLGMLRIHVQGAFHPTADVVAWIVGAGGATAPSEPMRLPLSVELPTYAVGRDSVLAAQAAGLSAERSQSLYDMLLAMQRAGVDNSFTLSSAYTAATFAIAESV